MDSLAPHRDETMRRRCLASMVVVHRRSELVLHTSRWGRLVFHAVRRAWRKGYAGNGEVPGSGGTLARRLSLRLMLARARRCERPRRRRGMKPNEIARVQDYLRRTFANDRI